jgi:DNA-3-methyladenine glycosylase II
LNEADAQLHTDPVMAGLIDDFGGPLPDDSGERADVYGSLIRAITSQQLSTKAASTIYGRLLERFGGRPPSPREILEDDPAELKAAAGLSRAKVTSLRSLAEHVLQGELEIGSFDALDDGEAIRRLVAVKGIGEWTAHMFLMFTLHRQDILATGDVGIRNAIMRAYELQAAPDPAAMTAIAEPWRPYRTRACLYLWRSAETPLSPDLQANRSPVQP